MRLVPDACFRTTLGTVLPMRRKQRFHGFASGCRRACQLLRPAAAYWRL